MKEIMMMLIYKNYKDFYHNKLYTVNNNYPYKYTVQTGNRALN